MHFEFKDEKVNAHFILTNELSDDLHRYPANLNLLKFIWNNGTAPVLLCIDNIPMSLPPNQIITATYLEHLSIEKQHEGLVSLLFNREFYCIQDHDHEVSCNGFLFFGSTNIPVISLDKQEQEKFNLLLAVFKDEFQTKDGIQGEMLRMLLKRFIIKSTRLAKSQNINETLNNSQIDMIREFNFLVNTHFREKKKVRDYADMMNKSPKTLSNLFAKYNQKTPIQLIHERLILEAKRLILYSDKTITEIAYQLGFDEVAQFSKLFKKITHHSPASFKEKEILTT